MARQSHGRMHGGVTRRGALAQVAGAGAAMLIGGCALREAGGALLPVDPAATAAPDLVDLARADPRLRLDIRYATPANFMGRVLYPVAKAVLQRPAALALSRVQTRAEAAG